MAEEPVVHISTLFDGFEQAFARWQRFEHAPQDLAQTFIPLFEVLEWAAVIDDRLGKEEWAPHLRGLRWARNRTQHDWAMALEVQGRDELTLHPNIERESVPEKEWAWRDELAGTATATTLRDLPFYQSHLAGQPARVTLNLVRALFSQLRPYY